MATRRTAGELALRSPPLAYAAVREAVREEGEGPRALCADIGGELIGCLVGQDASAYEVDERPVDTHRALAAT